MSGLAVVWHLDGSPVRPDELEPMARQVSYRGPDGIRVHYQGCIGFVHLALNSTPESEHEMQPLLADGGRLVIVADARVDNRDELIEILEMPKPADGPIGDAAIILAAWRRWREDCPCHILGDFAFVVWDAESKTLFAARDALGVNSLHHARLGDVVCVTTEAQQILYHPACPRRLDEEVVVRWLVGEVEGNSTPFAGIHPVPVAHWLKISPASARIQRYWDIDPARQIRYKHVSDYAEELLEILRRSVTARLRSGAGVVASEMSGGMDSTTITALTRQLLPPNTKHMVFSFVYPTLKECDESPFIDELADSLGLDLHRLDGESSGAIEYPRGFLPSLENPAMVRNPLFVAIAERLTRQGGRVLLTGNGGDEFMWGNSFIYGHRFWRGDVRVLWEAARYCWSNGYPLWPTVRTLFVSPYVPEAVKRRIRALRGDRHVYRWPDWFPEETGLRLGLSNRRYPTARKGFSLPHRKLYDGAMNGLIRLTLDCYPYSMGPLGVEARHPFLDRRLAEFVFAAPLELWVRDQWPKWLLRRATEGLLPESVRWRRDKTIFSSYYTAGLDRNRAWVRDVLSDPVLQDHGCVDNAALLAHVRSALIDGRQKALNSITWPLATQVWFQHCRRTLGALTFEERRDKAQIRSI
jgi:asparagine synthase (glutamine-hydrolysing)